MNDDEAHTVAFHLEFAKKAKQREKNRIQAAKENAEVISNKPLVKAIRKDLARGMSFKAVAKKHRVKHYTVIYVWRN